MVVKSALLIVYMAVALSIIRLMDIYVHVLGLPMRLCAYVLLQDVDENDSSTLSVGRVWNCVLYEVLVISATVARAWLLLLCVRRPLPG